jgi:pimeloyl-ACP methyl ester carboxylesterase
MRSSLVLLASILEVSFTGPPALAQPAPEFEAKIAPAPCRQAMANDRRRCFQVDVPEDYANPHGRHIQLDGYVIPASAPGAQKLALFLFSGGPGERVTDDAGFPTAFAAAIPDHDVVAIDQRGTGTTPDIRCRNPTDDANLQSLMIDEFPVEPLKKCLEAIRGKADPRFYTTAASAEDIELERRALGYGKIDLFGGSYGTELSQAYIHLYGDEVRSASLYSPVAPDTTVPEAFARHTEMSLMGVLDLCMEDAACAKAFPDLKADLATVKAKLASGGLTGTFPKGPKGKRLHLSAGMAATAWRAELYGPQGAARVPMQLHAAAHGDVDDFIAGAVEYRRGIEEDISNGLYLTISCAESMPRNDIAALHADEAGTLFGSFRTDQLLAACKVWPRGADMEELHHLKTWDGPVLASVGQFDPVTPAVYAERLMTQFPNGRLLRLPNQAHGGTEEAQNCLFPLYVKFIKTADAKSLDARCTETLKFPPFVLAPPKPAAGR